MKAEVGPRAFPRGEGRRPANVTYAGVGDLLGPPPLTVILQPSWHLASLCGLREPALLGDTGRVSWVRAHLADCQRAQVLREGKEGKAGRGGRSGISSGKKRQRVINSESESAFAASLRLM